MSTSLQPRADAAIAYRSAGEGAPLLLLPGIGQGADIWEGVLPRLTAHFRCLTFDPRGAGTRRAETDGVTLDGLADDAAAVIESAGARSAAILGWSMGGAVAQRMATRHPDLVDALVLLSTMSHRSDRQQLWTSARVALAAAQDRAAAELAVLPWLFSPSFLVTSDRAVDLARTQARLTRADPAALQAQAEALTGFDERTALGRVRVPALVVVGAEDVVTPVRDAVALANALPVAELEVLPRGGHAAVLEFPAETLAPIVRFLRRHNPATPSSPPAPAST